ncbi:hypothetical protein DYI26_10210 [Halomonas litopenaei]|nr:hypothetical protein [Halomonas litopenaei]
MFGPGDGVIRVGDSSSHGGTVVTGQANYLVDGIPVAVVGDMVACPQKGHGVCPIVEGHPTFSVNGKAVAFHGCSTACGATLFSSTSDYHALGSLDTSPLPSITQHTQHQGGHSNYYLTTDTGVTPPPVVNIEADRLKIILTNAPAIFEISENRNTHPTNPLHELDFMSEVRNNDFMYYEVAIEVGVDPALLMAIAHMESTRGWYDRFTAMVQPPKTFRPMNIYLERWLPLAQELGYDREDIINNTRDNIRLGAEIIKRIEERVTRPTVEKVASIYYFLGSELVNNYGIKVKEFYETQPWIR